MARLRTLGRKLNPPAPRFRNLFLEKTRREKKVNSFYISNEWKCFITALIAKRGRRCEMCGAAQCRIFGDHIIELSDGGAPLDQTNIMLLCGSCHTTKTAAARKIREAKKEPNAIRYAHTRMDITLVCGPPRAGKNTYVTGNMRKGDLVLDLDAIWAALSLTPSHEAPESNFVFACEARDAIYARIAQGSPQPGHRGWIISQAPTSRQRHDLSEKVGATRIVIIATPEAECIRRLSSSNDPRPHGEMQQAIQRWWSEYEPDFSGTSLVIG